MAPSPPDPVSDEEAARLLAAILRRGAGGTLTHEAACFMATVCAEHLVDQLGLAGYAVVHRDQLTGAPGPLFSR